MVRDSTWRVYWGRPYKQLGAGVKEDLERFESREWKKFFDEGAGATTWFGDYEKS